MSRKTTSSRKYQVGLTLDDESLEKLDELAELMDLSRSETTRQIILDRWESEAIKLRRKVSNGPAK